jgi:hypothetical protein
MARCFLKLCAFNFICALSLPLPLSLVPCICIRFAFVSLGCLIVPLRCLLCHKVEASSAAVNLLRPCRVLEQTTRHLVCTNAITPSSVNVRPLKTVNEGSASKVTSGPTIRVRVPTKCAI